VLDLVRWADVLTESFSPNVMRTWGLDYESLRQVKPDLIMLSTCLMGQTGPLSTFAGFGNLAAAISGFYNLAGWPDRAPAGPFGAYTDTVAPRFTAAAILAALDHRRRTGQGQYIDQSQAESALHFLAPAILDYTVNGRVQERLGNRDPAMAPHGVYPTAGEDCWIAIAAENDQQWQALCAVLERPALLHDERFATPEARLAYQDALDTIVAAWTKSHEAGAAEAALQMRGVPASALQNSRELCDDPQLAHRSHLVRLAHPILGTTIIEGSRFRLSRTPAKIDRVAPTLGGDSHYVLETILGYSAERIAELVIEGALE
jgi:benzylsuccinate CoA-transferase BbsF subunit